MMFIENTEAGIILPRRMNLDYLLAEIIIYRQLLLKLRGNADEPEDTGSRESDQNFLEKMLIPDNTSLKVTYCCSKMKAAYLFGEYEQALAMADEMRQDVQSIESFMLYMEYIFYYSLAITASHETLGKGQRKYYWKVLKKNRRQMNKWSGLCAENYLHKHLLLEAEKARLNGRDSEAGPLYDQAIEEARKNGFTQNEALAGELAAKYYINRGRDKIARIYMAGACSAYSRWGAVKKAESLRAQYPQLLAGMTGPEKTIGSVGILERALATSAPGANHPAGESGLEILSQATQGGAAGDNAQNEAQHYLKIAMESAGADKGCLILEKDGDLFIDAARGDCGPGAAAGPVALKDCEKISAAVVRYVARTKEAVLLNDGEDPGIFSGDPYLGRHRPKSMLCLPVTLRGIPAGVLYLENTLTTGVFTLDRLEILKLLSSHMVYARKLEYLLDGHTPGEKDEMGRALLDPLTKRELQVLRLIAAGMSNKEIAQYLQLSNNTVKMHTMNIYQKLEVTRRVQAVNRAKELKLF